MKKSDLYFEYPEKLVALTPCYPSRVMWVEPKGEPQEITLEQLLNKPQPGDLFVINDTKVEPRRVWSQGEESEILFLKFLNLDQTHWEVLFPASKLKVGDTLKLPGEVLLTLIEKGLPQKVQSSKPLNEEYFMQWGELPLPPYIQKLRDQRHSISEDKNWYQTQWAQVTGSLAAPTASLHFTNQDLELLKNRKVQVESITLHVGLGTFLPVKVEDITQHKMHGEWVYVKKEVREKIEETKKRGHKVWALGTTVTRTLESLEQGLLSMNDKGDFWGETSLFIYPGYQFQVVDRLLTNFHQPESTLLALVSSFQDLNRVKECYQWAIKNSFRLFSYGDLSVWVKPHN